MHILFPSSPIAPKKVHPSFQEEADAARTAGFSVGLVNLEALLGAEIVVTGIPSDSSEPILYRGWLMKPTEYAALSGYMDDCLTPRPKRYRNAYFLPNWYELIAKGDTPDTAVIGPGYIDVPLGDLGRDDSNLAPVVSAVRDYFGGKAQASKNISVDDLPDHPLILKDFLKSAKHRWYDACFISSWKDSHEIERVTRNFLKIQGENLTGGLCFREFVPYKRVGVHPKTRMPLVNEWRVFLYNCKVIYMTPYWPMTTYDRVSNPTKSEISRLARRFQGLGLIALDIAEKESGGWQIIEVNPGGASGIPETGNVLDFYTNLRKVLPQ